MNKEFVVGFLIMVLFVSSVIYMGCKQQEFINQSCDKCLNDCEEMNMIYYDWVIEVNHCQCIDKSDYTIKVIW